MANPLESRVLIVEDEPDTCSNLSDILTDLGYQVDCAHDGLAALELVLRGHYDVVLIDMKLPGGDGSDVFRQVRESDPRARTVLVTGCRPETDPLVDRILTEGIDAACYKPLDVPQLLDTLDRLAKLPE